MMSLSKRPKVWGEGEWMVAQTVMLLLVRVSAITISITCPALHACLMCTMMCHSGASTLHDHAAGGTDREFLYAMGNMGGVVAGSIATEESSDEVRECWCQTS